MHQASHEAVVLEITLSKVSRFYQYKLVILKYGNGKVMGRMKGKG